MINMTQANLFWGKTSDDANAHLQLFLEACVVPSNKGVVPDALHIRLFPFLLLGMAK